MVKNESKRGLNYLIQKNPTLFTEDEQVMLKASPALFYSYIVLQTEVGRLETHTLVSWNTILSVLFIFISAVSGRFDISLVILILLSFFYLSRLAVGFYAGNIWLERRVAISNYTKKAMRDRIDSGSVDPNSVYDPLIRKITDESFSLHK
jgi:uncharacterized membrane protein